MSEFYPEVFSCVTNRLCFLLRLKPRPVLWDLGGCRATGSCLMYLHLTELSPDCQDRLCFDMGDSEGGVRRHPPPTFDSGARLCAGKSGVVLLCCFQLVRLTQEEGLLGRCDLCGVSVAEVNICREEKREGTWFSSEILLRKQAACHKF